MIHAYCVAALKHKFHLSIWQIILIGIILRLLAAAIFNHSDELAITALSRSIADTQTLIDGYIKLPQVQLYGRIYYQVIAVWLHFLQFSHILSIGNLFGTIPFKPSEIGYLQAFPSFGPELYQLIAIKLIQFLYDGIFLFYLLKTSDFLQLKGKSKLYLTIFWACNPIFIYVGYGMFQSDIAIISSLMAAAYYTMKSLKEDKGNLSWNKVFALAWIAFGAVIKQVPLLILPVLLILFSQSWITLLFSLASFAIFYFILYQPWSVDAIILKSQFLTSTESTNLFNFQLNGLNIFFLFYVFSIGFIWYMRSMIRSKYIYVIHAFTLIITVLYISEDISGFFPQFAVWILPFLALLCLIDSSYVIFLFAMLIGFFKQMLVDATMLSGILATTFGTPLLKSITYTTLINQVFSMDIVLRLITTVFSAFCIILYVFLIRSLYGKDLKLPVNLNLKNATLLMLCIFFIVVAGEFLIKRNYTQLTSYTYSSDLTQVPVTTTPLSFIISNQRNEEISGLVGNFSLNQYTANDYTDIQAIDMNSGKQIMLDKINDFAIGHSQNTEILFPQHINASHIKVLIFTEHNYNQISITGTKGNILPYTQIDFPNYDAYYSKNYVSITYPNQVLALNIRGVYSWKDIAYNLGHNVKKSLIFFIAYTAFILLLILFIIFPFITSRHAKHKG